MSGIRYLHVSGDRRPIIDRRPLVRRLIALLKEYLHA